ncbi:MAG: hypothetical protein DHS20C14_01650 [Phycisphaeraceae bacterium]|nr:MAG: hypothetical protein DHS20C14_01650 [Phycisphaeraceae bacterium]
MPAAGGTDAAWRRTDLLARDLTDAAEWMLDGGPPDPGTASPGSSKPPPLITVHAHAHPGRNGGREVN